MSEEEHPIVKFVRLQNGDDLITEAIETEDENGISYTIFYPLKVVYIPSEREGYVAIAFAPWVFPRMCDEHEYVIRSEDVMIISDASKKMNTYYWESVDQHYNNEPIKEEKPQEEDGLNQLAEMLRQLELKRTYH